MNYRCTYENLSRGVEVEGAGQFMTETPMLHFEEVANQFGRNDALKTRDVSK